MGELVNTNGRGPAGTSTNSPICDDATMACNQNRPAVPHGSGANVRIPGLKPGLTDQDREFISEIGRTKNRDKSPLTIEQLTRLRDEAVELLGRSIENSGPASPGAIWFQKLIAAYDEAIADAKSPLGCAINDLKTALAKPSPSEKERKEKVSELLKIMKKKENDGTLVENDPMFVDAMGAIVEAVKQDVAEKEGDLDKIVNREKRSPGSVPDDEFRKKLLVGMGVEQQKQKLGIGESEGPSKMMQLAVEALNLTADRRVASLKTLISQGKNSPESVPEEQLTKLMVAVLGDERQRELEGITDPKANPQSLGAEVLLLFIEKRRLAINKLYEQVSRGDRRVDEKQVRQAISDYDAAVRQARRWGAAIPGAPNRPD